MSFDPSRDYPLGTSRPDLIRTPGGIPLDELALYDDRVVATELRATPETLRLQAEVARAAGRPQLADNLLRAAELAPLPDEPEQLATRLRELRASGIAFVATVGGTGLGPRDRTVDVVRELLTTEVPGLMEAARGFGQARTPFAMLSRGIAGFTGETLIVTFPGSRRGAIETLAALHAGLIHLLDVFRGARHRGGYGEKETAA